MKKKNPAIHLKQSEVKKLKNDAVNLGIKYSTILFFSIMRDKEGYGVKRLTRVYDAMAELADSIAKGYVSYSDLERVLLEEADIRFEL